MDEERLKQAFKDALALKEDIDYASLRFAETEGWDSIAHMQLIAAIEDAYDIMLETQDVLALSSYPIAKEIIKKYVKKKLS